MVISHSYVSLPEGICSSMEDALMPHTTILSHLTSPFLSHDRLDAKRIFLGKYQYLFVGVPYIVEVVRQYSRSCVCMLSTWKPGGL